MLLFQLPKTVAVASSRTVGGANLYFYLSGTSTAATVYTDADLTTAHNWPVVAASTGLFPAIYLNESVAYKARLTTSSGSLIYEVDPVNDTRLSVWAGGATGTADAITLTPSEALAAYETGQTVGFIAAAANTGATTVNVSGLGAKAIAKNGSTALAAGDIASGAVVTITYDGTRFQLSSGGADAGTLDGYDSAAFPRLAAANTFTANQKVQAGFAEQRSVATYGTTVTPNCSNGNWFTITATDTVAFAIAAPTNPVDGQCITITVKNGSGGSLGTITWNAVYKMSAWTSPADGYNRSVVLRYDGTNWIQIVQTGADVSN